MTLKSLLKRDSIVLVCSAVAQRTAGGIMTPLFPILATTFLSFNEATYSATVSGIDLATALAAIAVGSLLTLRIGPKWSAILVFLVMGGVALFIMLGRDLWMTTGVFVAIYALYSLCNVLSSIATNPLRMQLSDPRVAATQFTIYNSLSNLPVSLGATLFATLGGSKALESVMAVALGLFLLGAAILVLIRIGRAPVRVGPVPEID